MANTSSALDAIRGIVGPKGFIDDAAGLEAFITEERGLWRGTSEMAVKPSSTKEFAAVVSVCAEASIAVVPHGGNTGLVGGNVPHGGIVLSTARMNKIRELDPIDCTMTVDAGCILADLQVAADKADRLFPLSLGAEGSCHIGGNLSTNAGGVQVLRYGNARDLVLGLEVVLPDGTVWDGLRRLRKDNTGYDLKQLFIGAEGTLGVITGAVLKLFPRPARRETAMAVADGMAALLQLFTRANAAVGTMMTAFEVANRVSVEGAVRLIKGVSDPFAAEHPAYALIELSAPRPDDVAREALESLLGVALEDGVIADAVIAQSDTQAKELWRIREAIPEWTKLEGGSIKHDVSVPVSRVPAFVEQGTKRVTAEMPGVRVVAFGHLGDGNIHFNLSYPVGMEKDAFMKHWNRFNAIVHELAVGMDGSFSAEHGIGELKLDDVSRFKPEAEIELMRTLKRAFDPKGIMNPGKVIPEQET